MNEREVILILLFVTNYPRVCTMAVNKTSGNNPLKRKEVKSEYIRIKMLGALVKSKHVSD